MAIFLTKSPIVDSYDLSSLRLIMSGEQNWANVDVKIQNCISLGAAPLGKDLVEEVRKRLPYVRYIAQGYGMVILKTELPKIIQNFFRANFRLRVTFFNSATTSIRQIVAR